MLKNVVVGNKSRYKVMENCGGFLGPNELCSIVFKVGSLMATNVSFMPKNMPPLPAVLSFLYTLKPDRKISNK